MDHPKRSPLVQRFSPFRLVVGITPTPLNQSNQQVNIAGLYDAFIISVPKAAANTVWLGDASVNVVLGNGLEIPQGLPIMLSIENERQLYELQSPVVDRLCDVPESIPFIVWSPSEIYLVAVALTPVGVILFPAPYV